MTLRTFRDIVVYPTQGLLRPPWTLFRGGPDWPRFWTQVAPRTCRYAIPIPLDRRPKIGAAVTETLEQGVWCGPVTDHFGHAIASFGTRIARSAQLPADVPLIFSMSARDGTPPAFFWEMLEHFGVPRARVVLVRRPVQVETLHVFPQAERLFGGAPGDDYLALLNTIAGPAPATGDRRLYVSRAVLPKGRIAGEGEVERGMAAAGFATMRPETMPLSAQLRAYRAAEHIVFSEGSAVHALQLLGPIAARVTVLTRRPEQRIARAALAARARSLDYVDAVRGVVHGARLDGSAQVSAGLTVLDEDRMVAALDRAGIDIAGAWSPERYVAARDADVAQWVARRLGRHRTPSAIQTMRRTLARAGLDGDYGLPH